MTIEQLLQAAAEHHDAGRFAEAETLYRQALQQNPRDPDVLHCLGLLCLQQGRNAEALKLLDEAVAVDGDFAPIHANRARALGALNRADDAIMAWQRALALQPDDHAGQLALAALLWRAGKKEQAADAYRRAIAIRPDIIEAYCDLTIVLAGLGRSDEALEVASRAVNVRPDHALAHNNLGILFKEHGQTSEALAAYRRAIELKPDLAEAPVNLGNLLCEIGRPEEAIVAHNQALAINPDLANAWTGLGNAHYECARFDEAIAAHRKAFALDPNHSMALNNLGNALVAAGQTSEAVDSLGRSLAIRPDPGVYANRLYAIWFDSRFDAASILREHRDWNERYARPLAAEIRPHANDRGPDRPLRIGYVSPHLYWMTVGSNLLPLLIHHDRTQFEVFCYSSSARKPDQMTGQLAGHADHWRDIAKLTDEQAAEMIRADRIDILIDLAVQMPPSRMLTFARKPAPVQVTYLGYCGTTGMDAMDYRLSDRYFDPPGSEVGRYSERTVLLPHGYWAYEPCGPMPEVGPLPALAAGHVTFGSMNQVSKPSLATRDLWAKVLLAVPGSRMLIHAAPGSHRDRLCQQFFAQGVAADRIMFQERKPWVDYARTFNRIDIALDSLPNNGGIASCDALMMGVPLITRAGNTSVGRAGSSILNNIGLPELIAETPGQFVQIASGLAADLPRLAALRAGLRQRMEQSPLRDHKTFARDIETAYRQMWREWCRRSR
jgi:protein O-GlcNAc transferase